MLRAAMQLSRATSHGPFAARTGRQWQGVRANIMSDSKRSFADIQKISASDSKARVLPGSANAATNQPVPPGGVAIRPNCSTPPPASTPSTSTSKSMIQPSSGPLNSPPPPPPPVKKPRRIFRRLFAIILFLTIAGFGGGVYYSRVNDNFHDFFTEYVPFGEDAVLYFEEREFRRRFPTITHRHQKPRDTGSKTTIPSQSGVSWKVTDVEKNLDGKHNNALQPNGHKSSEAAHSPQETEPQGHVKAVVDTGGVTRTAKDDTLASSAPEPPSRPTKPTTELTKVLKPEPTVTTSKKESPIEKPTAPPRSEKVFKAPEVNEPSRFPPENMPIDAISISSAEEPIVQDLVGIVNDIILVVNADNASAKFSSTIAKAKSELGKVGNKIKQLKNNAAKEADEKVKASQEELNQVFKEFSRRIENQMQEQDIRWKSEYEQERQRLQDAYEQRLKSEIGQANQVNEQRFRNELLEQAVEMKRNFIAEVKDRVEEERNSRLGKLSELSSTVNELEQLTTDWSSVVDTNLKTQHLHVAVGAVRANIQKSQAPQPFVRELAALKGIAADDLVVNAAIASINPTAYQYGIPNSSQLIERFRRVAAEVRKTSLLPKEAGVASHASSYMLNKILFKKNGLVDGNDVESILTRTEVFLEEGNLDEAAREINCLSGWAKTLSKDWLTDVRKVLEVQQALDVIATEARLQSLRVE